MLRRTPIGMTVAAEVELIAVEGRNLRFRVSCRDDDGPIGEGFHERAIIDHAKFMARLAAKAEKCGGTRGPAPG
ncbi:thioesterase family protein [Methylocella sp.]|uniref:thioesterase family protein n=1 Tax=Methylocella sp. TaxID=1978226 RepID=UPI003C78B14B